MRGSRTISVAPADGTLLWDHTAGPPSVSIVQPAVTPEGDVLIAAGDCHGRHRHAPPVADATGLTDGRWTSAGIPAA